MHGICFAALSVGLLEDNPTTSRGRHSLSMSACELRPPSMLRRPPIDPLEHIAELRR